MWIITKLNAAETVNSNPRRGWVCQLFGTGVVHWVEEGYQGPRALKRWMERDETRFLSDRFHEALTVDTTVKEYKRFWSIAEERH